MLREHSYLVVIGVVAALAMLMTLIGVDSLALRVLFGLPLALFLPGYVFTRVFLKRELRRAERVLFSVGLSLALSIIAGFILNALPWGIQPASWALLLGGMTLGGVLFAITRPRGASLALPQFQVGISVWQGLVFGVAALLVVAAVGIAQTGARNQPTPSFTQLWLLPAEQPNASVIRIGVRNLEGAAMTYSVRLDGDGAPIHEWAAIELSSGETWEMTFDLPARSADATIIRASLYRASAPTAVYRHVMLQRR